MNELWTPFLHLCVFTAAMSLLHLQKAARHLWLDEQHDNFGMLYADAGFHTIDYCSERSPSYKAISSCPMPSQTWGR